MTEESDKTPTSDEAVPAEPTSESTKESASAESEEESDESDDEDTILPIPAAGYTVDLAKDHSASSETSTQQQTQTAESPADSENSAANRKRKLSRKEREQLKKKQQGQSTETLQPKPQQQQQKGQQQQQQKPKGPAPQKVPRGKHGKLKKMKEKYGDQDEEERRAMMELLKSTGKKQQEEKPVEAKVVKSPEQEAEDLKRKMIQRKEAEAKRIARLKEEEELRTMMREEKLDELSDADRARIQETTAKNLGVNLALLTSNPKPGDVVLFAIPVCAPYEALKDHKYRVKITPGTLKKGKAAQLAISVFLKHSDISPVEKELIKAIPEGELTGALIPNVKLSTPGLASILQQKNKGKGKVEDIEITA